MTMTCKCGHPCAKHGGDGELWCRARGCECVRFEQPEPRKDAATFADLVERVGDLPTTGLAGNGEYDCAEHDEEDRCFDICDGCERRREAETVARIVARLEEEREAAAYPHEWDAAIALVREFGGKR